MLDPRPDSADRHAASAGDVRAPGRMLRNVVVAGPAVLVLLLATLALGVFGLERNARVLVAHTHRVLNAADSLGDAVHDAALARREFSVLPDSARLLGASARVRAHRALGVLRTLTRDNVEQQQRLDRLTPLVTSQLAGSVPSPIEVASLRELLRAFEAAEERLLAERELREARLASVATVGVLVGAIVAALLALLTSRLLARYAERQAAQASALAVQNERLQEHTVELEMQQQAQREQAAEMEAQQEQLVEQNLELIDLTARLSHEESRIKRLIETVPSGLIETDAGGRIVWANAAAERILRLDLDALLTRGYGDASWDNQTWNGESLSPTHTAIGRALATGTDVQATELTIADPATGDRVFLRINASPVRDDLGMVTGALAAFDDATIEARATARLRRVAESGVVGVFNWTLSGGIADANAAFLQMLDYTPDDLAAGRVDWRAMTPPEFADADARAVAELLATGTHRAYRKAYCRRDGTPVPVVIASAFLPGSREQGVCVCLDVRSLANAEHAERIARTQAERLQAMTAGFSGALTPQEVAAVLADAGRTAAGAESVLVALVTRADTPGAAFELERVAEAGRGLEAMMPGARAPLDADAPLPTAARTRAPLWRGDSRHRAWCALPLAVERDDELATAAAAHTLGAVAFRFAQPQAFDAAQQRYLQTIADQAAQALERARLYREAQAGNEAKTGFMATVSHELRTPLNALIGYSDLLLLGIPEPIPAASAAQVGRMRTAARHLLGLIEEILLHARLEAGRVEVRSELVDLAALVDEVATVVRPLAEARGLTFQADADAGATVTTDPGKLRQILINLAGNAVKFTDHGGVTLHAGFDALHDAVVIRVTDTGVGIAPEYLDKVFDPFWQVGQHRSAHRPAGTGLGLSVSRRLARLLGGEITVESTPGRGSSFTMRIARHGSPALLDEPRARATVGAP